MRELYHDLEIWQRANSLCLKVFKLTNELPRSERSSLFLNIRNASEHIPLKIAIGAHTKHVNDYIGDLRDSYRLLVKLKTEILIARHLQYITASNLKHIDAEINELIRLLLAMVNDLEVKNNALHPAFAYWYLPIHVN